MPLALATWPPARSNPNAKLDPSTLRPTPGQLPKPRRAGGVNLSSRIRDFGELPVNYEDAGWR